MGQILAAQNDLNGAINYYEQASNRFPDLNFIAALSDLYKLAGRDADAAKQYELAEQIGRFSEWNGAIYNRSLAMFYADHDLKTETAYQMAAKEFENRRDIYGADAAAWTAVKSGKTSEAQTAIKEALKLGTNDARLFYDFLRRQHERRRTSPHADGDQRFEQRPRRKLFSRRTGKFFV